MQRFYDAHFGPTPPQILLAELEQKQQPRVAIIQLLFAHQSNPRPRDW